MVTSIGLIIPSTPGPCDGEVSFSPQSSSENCVKLCLLYNPYTRAPGMTSDEPPPLSILARNVHEFYTFYCSGEKFGERESAMMNPPYSSETLGQSLPKSETEGTSGPTNIDLCPTITKKVKHCVSLPPFRWNMVQLNYDTERFIGLYVSKSRHT